MFSAFLLSITVADLVSRASWLAKLGPHAPDFIALTLKFYVDGHLSHYKDKNLITWCKLNFIN